MGQSERKSLLISLEGIDASGKTTQAYLLNQLLIHNHLAIASFKFPDYALTSGEIIKQFLSGEIILTPLEIFILFSQNRVERLQEILNANSSSRVVIFDRYSESEYAYGQAYKLSLELLITLEAIMPPAEVVLLLDVDPVIAMNRRQNIQAGDIFEKNYQFQTEVRHNYLNLAEHPIHPRQKWIVLDGSKSIQSIHKSIVDLVFRYLNMR